MGNAGGVLTTQVSPLQSACFPFGAGYQEAQSSVGDNPAISLDGQNLHPHLSTRFGCVISIYCTCSFDLVIT